MTNTDMPSITPSEAHGRPDRHILLDVREDDEWAAGHAPGADHFPLGGLDPAAFDAGAKVLCVCRSGGRAGKAVEALRAAGVDAVNVAGGMKEWAEAGLPVVTDDETTGTVI